MKRMIMICVALLGSAMLFASPATAKPSKPDKPENAMKLAAKQCAAEKKADKAAFRALYGKRAMQRCIKGESKKSEGELKNAAKACKAERAADPAGFESTYGDSYSSNAFGKCVSTKVKQEDSEDTETFQNSAQECRAERAEDRDAFKQTYGSAKSKGRNAFGKCVSMKVKEPAPTV